MREPTKEEMIEGISMAIRGELRERDFISKFMGSVVTGVRNSLCDPSYGMYLPHGSIVDAFRDGVKQAAAKILAENPELTEK
jgi:hypothetical protein